MAIVNERYAASKPVQVDPKTGKPISAAASATPVRASSPTLDSMNDANGGFFGSFFASKNKKKMAAMEPPPSTLKASGTLSEREGVEVEVISKSRAVLCHLIAVTLTACRTPHKVVLQHCSANHDRHGTESYHAQPCPVCPKAASGVPN
jgi:hypothetical protein